MFGVGRDLCGSSGPTHLPKQGHLQRAAQDLVQVGLEYLQRTGDSATWLQPTSFHPLGKRLLTVRLTMVAQRFHPDQPFLSCGKV